MNVADLIHKHAKDRPDHWAVLTPTMNISWGQLDQLIWSMAMRFKRQGLEEGDRVGISMDHPVFHLITCLALARMGVAQAAVSTAAGPQNSSSLIRSLGLKKIICDRKSNTNTFLDSIEVSELDDIQVSSSDMQALRSRGADLTWLFLQSSGTTGSPKYAELSHLNALQRFSRLLPFFNYSDRDILWAIPKLDFVVAKLRVVNTLLGGGAICFPLGLTEGNDLVNYLNEVGVTIACGTSSHLYRLVSINKSMPTLRFFEAGSAVISERIRIEFKRKVSANLYILYGTNEADGITLAAPDTHEKIPNTVGLPIHGVDIEIVDLNGLAQPVGVTGEIRVRGPGVIEQYFKNPRETMKSFNEGWFYPGDLGYLTKEGALVLQGRKDDMMNFDGISIYPAEIENVLASHPAVNEVAAFPIKCEGIQELPIAAVTLRESVSEASLIEYCTNLIGIRCPKRVLILDQFPRNPMGKILKRELAISFTHDLQRRI